MISLNREEKRAVVDKFKLYPEYKNSIEINVGTLQASLDKISNYLTDNPQKAGEFERVIKWLTINRDNLLDRLKNEDSDRYENLLGKLSN